MKHIAQNSNTLDNCIVFIYKRKNWLQEIDPFWLNGLDNLLGPLDCTPFRIRSRISGTAASSVGFKTVASP